ncbi:IucA/IucC family protein [Phaeobacter inhibens]|uniref:IucA/IucC family protein n=1 Tax=Phaeobacter inhibens TaxID=221822 RepID=UPI00076BB1FA|nr:IucA/IucC family protein [Phaeobacter inhibens]KXF92838.1 hypothetical protein AT574_00505 [Phaeobacter inhibens]WHP70764.1 IucA/IucC family protein [Phaeobacter inhibens]
MPLPDCAIPTPALPLCSPTDAMQRVLRQLCEALLSEGCAQGVTTQDGRLCWHLGPAMFRAQGRCGAFSRYRLMQGSIEIARDHSWQPADLEEVLSSIDAPEAALAGLRADLTRTAELDDLNHQQIPRPPRRHQLGVAQMERALHEGHPYHPCYKARSGFSDTDHLRFGPEAGQRFRLIGLLFHPDLIQQNLPDDDFWPRELGQPEWNRIQGIAADQGIDLGTGGFALLPVHPWQWDQLAQDPLILAWQSDNQLLMIGEIGDHYSATQSVRVQLTTGEPATTDATTTNWVETGDLGYLTADGGLVFTARADDMINVAGLNVYPQDVERAVMSLPDVQDAVAFRLPDPQAGARVGLLFVSATLSETQLRAQCADLLADHQKPALLRRLPALPRQANGKISRRDIAERYASGTDHTADQQVPA